MFRETDPTLARGIERPNGPDIDLDHIEDTARYRASYMAEGVISELVATFTRSDWAGALLDLLEDDDTMAGLIPDPLSGEWAGQSISELFDLEVGEAYPDDEILDTYETAYRDTYRASLEIQARDLLEEEVRGSLALVRDEIEATRYLSPAYRRELTQDIDTIPGLEHWQAARTRIRTLIDETRGIDHTHTLARDLDNLERLHNLYR